MYRYLLADRDFRELNIPLKPADYRDLETRVRKNGRVAPIPVWNGYILTGYEQYDLCQKYHRICVSADFPFLRKSGAKAWICREQLKRKELCRPAVYWLISRLYAALLEEENRKTAKDRFQYKQLSPSHRSEQLPETIRTNTTLLKRIGLEYSLSVSCIRSYVVFGKDLDQLEDMFPGFRNRVLKGEVDIPIMYMGALMKMSKYELGRKIADPHCRRLVPPEAICDEIRKKRDPNGRNKIRVRTAIKETPAFDPDAEVNGMAYTVGAWIRAVKKINENADFKSATVKGKENLYRALRALVLDIDSLVRKLEEAEHE